MNKSANSPQSGTYFLEILSNLRKIVNHPYLFFAYYEKVQLKNNLSNEKGNLIKHIGDLENLNEYKTFKLQKAEIQKSNFGQISEIQAERDIPLSHWQKSGKLEVMIRFLELWKSEKQNHKVLLFSQTKKVLNIVERLLQMHGIYYDRMDGDVSVSLRLGKIQKFNETRDHDLSVFLLTTKVGSLGINLTGANKVLIFDPDWNPMVDLQATERALRIGQKRDVAIYRLVCEETVEEKIYHRQVFKKYMADRILSDPTRRRLFERDNLYELFTVPEKPVQKLEPLEDGEIDTRKAPNRGPKKGILKLSPTAINEDKKYLKKQKKQLLKVKDEETRKTKKDLTESLLTQICQPPEPEKDQMFNLQQIELSLKAGRRVDKLIRQGGMRLTTCEYEPMTLDEIGFKKQIIRTFESLGHSLNIDDLFDPLSEILQTKEQMVMFKKALKSVALFDPDCSMWKLTV